MSQVNQMRCQREFTLFSLVIYYIQTSMNIDSSLKALVYEAKIFSVTCDFENFV